MKQCKTCNETKDLDQFNQRQSKCKPCQYAHTKQHYLANKESYDARQKTPKRKEYQKKYMKKYNPTKKDGHYSVYLLPDHNYVGQTNSIYHRMTSHRSDNGRNTDNVRVLYTTKSRDEALELEALLHDMGYEGRHTYNNKNRV